MTPRLMSPAHSSGSIGPVIDPVIDPVKRLILAGGGHSHIEVLRRFAIEPPRNTQVTVITPSPLLLYTGMWPGWVAGLYSREECAIDVERLARAAGCAWVEASLTGIDPVARSVRLDDGSGRQYDCLSIDVGSTPPLGNIPGAAAHAMPVKPVQPFFDWWSGVVAEGRRSLRIGVVGAGTGGVELALAVEHRLRSEARGKARGEVFLVDSSETILPGQSALARRWIERIIDKRRIVLHLRSRIDRVEERCVHTPAGANLPFDHLIWATGAAAPSWLEHSGLTVDDKGFIVVNSSLQSVSHRQVFASGDIATQTGEPRPKAGVFAVRQGPVLADNLRRALAGKVLGEYRPQRHALALIGTGDRHAVAARGPLALSGKWVWRWKEKIDRDFVARYR